MSAPATTTAAARARAAFVRAFCTQPAVVARAPGRVNLIGEHTDYNDGFVLPIAIDLDCVAAVAPGEGLVRIISDDLGATFEAPAREAMSQAFWRETKPAAPRWAAYAAGTLACAARLAPRLAALVDARGVNLAIAGDVPLGAGLSSSAALEVSVALAACTLAGDVPVNLAQVCQRAEHEFAGTPCGVMDQFASLHARAGRALLLDCASLAFEHIPMPPGWCVIVLDTGVRHELATGEYARRRASCERVARALGIPSLRHAREHDLARPIDAAREVLPEDRARARHVIREIERTRVGARALARGDLALFGTLMVQSHASLRDDYVVSCPELDAGVQALLDAPGVAGARMTGGGFGGSAIAMVRADEAPDAVAEAARLFAQRTGCSARVRLISPGPGASVLEP